MDSAILKSMQDYYRMDDRYSKKDRHGRYKTFTALYLDDRKLTDKEIAAELSIHISTVKRHKVKFEELYEKFKKQPPEFFLKNKAK